MATKPSISKGTRDFSSVEIAKRNYLKNILQITFEEYGFSPIETPSFEKLETDITMNSDFSNLFA